MSRFTKTAAMIVGLLILFGPAGAWAQTKVLVFSKTTGFRHDSIPDGIAAIKKLGAENNFAVDATEDAAVFNDTSLAQYRAIIFLNTTGDLFDDNQKAAFQRYIRSGRGFAGVHSASDTEHNWAWYGGLVGAYFQSHPAIQKASIKVENRNHPSTTSLPERWERTDEWYNFGSNPRGKVQVLATLDEATYSGGAMGADHPTAWYQFYDGGRSWYTGGGHTRESYSEPLFLQHLLGGIQFASGLKDAGISSVSAASFSGTTLAGESIVSAFGAGLATAAQAATTTPLPTSLAGTSVKVKDSAGAERLAPLFFVSPTQINYQTPSGAAAGAATVIVTSGNVTLASGAAQITAVAPGLFAANSNGQGIAAALALRVRADNSQSYEPVARYDAAQSKFVAVPIDLGPDSEQVFLVLFGTGIRFRSSLAAVSAKVGGENASVLYAGAQGGFAGLDQVNLRLPRNLIGRGEVDVVLIVDSQAANIVRINIR